MIQIYFHHSINIIFAYKLLLLSALHTRGGIFHHDKNLCAKMPRGVLCLSDWYPRCVHVSNEISYFVKLEYITSHEFLQWVSSSKQVILCEHFCPCCCRCIKWTPWTCFPLKLLSTINCEALYQYKYMNIYFCTPIRFSTGLLYTRYNKT